MSATPRYFEHLTIGVGHSRRCWREEVADDVLELLRPILLAAVTTGRQVSLSDVVSPRCTITAATGRGRALLVTIWVPPPPGPDSAQPIPYVKGDTRFDVSELSDAERTALRQGPMPLITMGVAPTSLAGTELWRQLAPGGGEEQLPRPAAPPVPWCAVKVYATAALWPEVMSWRGDFERGLAWVWMAGGVR